MRENLESDWDEMVSQKRAGELGLSMGMRVQNKEEF
jgi:hypothetical protein